MLSEEEQAVENLEKLVKLRKNIRGEITHDTCICGTSDLDTGLKLINKLKKENEELSVKNIENICRGVEEEVLQEYRDKITKLQKENHKNLISDVSRIAIELGLEEDGTIDEIYAKIKEKDKQIDLMSEYIYNTQIECNVYYKNKEEAKEYFEKLAKEKGK